MSRPATRPSKKVSAAKTRAFLFSDLRDYTSYVEAKGDAAAARLLKDYRTLVRREVARHDGAEVKTEGDSFYVVFETPSSAIECAVAILRAADARSVKDPTAPLRIGVGVHAGQTVAYDDQFVGSAVNIASRLTGKAGAGELLISDTLRGLVRTSQSLPMTERGPLELKGVSEPVRAWSVGWQVGPDRAAPTSAPALPAAKRSAPRGQFLCPVVVGRDAETKMFAARVASAVDGSGGTVLVAGEAGVGKSAFVRQATDLAASLGFRLLAGLTRQSDGGLPYAPFVSAVRSGFRGLDRDELGRVLQRSAPNLAELFPELGRAAAAERSGIERHRLSVAFQHLFSAFSREAPVLLILEDLHWADGASLELLQHLARELLDSRILVLGTYRSDELHRRHPLLRALAELQRERLVTEIALKRLTPDETREVIRATLAQRAPDVSVSEALRDAIYERSEGNPFFTEELMKALVESGGLFFNAETGWGRKPIEELRIPGSIREAVRARVEGLTPDARVTLAAAATIGHRFPFDVLVTMRGIDEAMLEEQIREFVEQQLVNESDDEDAYEFRHALTREVVYDDLLVRERKRLHRAVAEALAAKASAEPAIVAHHLLAAGEQQRAVPVLIEAADRAGRADAPREAAAHYARAIEIGVADEQLARVIEHQAEAYLLFDPARAIKTAEEAAARYREAGDRRGESRVLRLAARGSFYEGQPAIAAQRTQQAIDVLAGEECVELGRAIAQLAGLHMTDRAMTEAIALADRAIALGERLGDPWTLAHALITRGSTNPGSDADLSDLRRGLALAVQHGIVEGATRGYNNTAYALVFQGAPAAERGALLDEGLAYGRAHGIERGALSFLLGQQLFIEYGQGEWDAALDTAGQVHFGPAMSQMYQWSHTIRGRIVAAREGPAAALPLYVEFATLGQPDIATTIILLADTASGFASAGKLAEARAQLDKLARAIAPYPRGAGDWATPRSTLAYSAAFHSLVTAVVQLGAPAWLDETDAAAAPGPLGDGCRALAAGVRALLAGDAASGARALGAGYEVFERVGFAAFWHELVAACVRSAAARDLALGREWIPLAERTRVFAKRVRARWWLDSLAEAGLSA